MKQKYFRVIGLFAAVLLAPTPGEAVNCNKNPNHPQCQGGGVAYQRAHFRGSTGDGVAGDGGAGCVVDPGFEYWTTIDGGDPECGTGGNVQVGLTGQEGLWFRPYRGSTNLRDGFPGPNRHFVLDFGIGFNDGSEGPCPDFDAFYSSVPAEVAPYVPLPNTDPCVDNVEALFRAGVWIFDLPEDADVLGATISVVTPTLNKKGKKSSIEWQQTVGTVTFVSPLMVTDSGIEDDVVTLSCDDACVVSVRKQGEDFGLFNMPVELTVKRVLCDANGVCRGKL
jgi:hypothetical protein